MSRTGRDTRPWNGQAFIHDRDGAIMANHAWLGSPRGGRRKMQGTQAEAPEVMFPPHVGGGSSAATSPRAAPNENENEKGAGVKSGHGVALAQRRTYEAKTVMGAVILGKDVQCPNNSNLDGSSAGLKTHLRSLQKPYRQPGLSQSSVMDTAIYGRDFDFSGPEPTVEHFERYGDHAGERSAHRTGKAFRKQSMSQSAVVDSLIYGRDIDGSGENPHDEFARKLTNEDRAGLHAYSKNTTDHPCHRYDLQHSPRLHVYSSIDHVVFGKNKYHQHAQHFIDPNDSYAGVRSGVKIVRRPSLDGADPFNHGVDPFNHGPKEVRMPLSAREHPSSRIRRCDTEPALAQERVGTPQGSQRGAQTPQSDTRRLPIDEHSPYTPQRTSGALATSPRARNPFGGPGPARGTPGATPRGSVSASSVCSSARGSPAHNLAVAFDDGASVSSRGSFKPPPRWR